MSERLFPPGLQEQIACVERELKMRGRVYPRRVQMGAMTSDQADHEIQIMQAVLRTLQVYQKIAREIAAYEREIALG